MLRHDDAGMWRTYDESSGHVERDNASDLCGRRLACERHGWLVVTVGVEYRSRKREMNEEREEEAEGAGDGGMVNGEVFGVARKCRSGRKGLDVPEGETIRVL